MKTNSGAEIEMVEQASSKKRNFDSEIYSTESISKFLMGPTSIMLVYSLWLSFHGRGWIWLPLTIIFFFATGISLVLRNDKKSKSLLKLLLRTFVDVISIGTLFAVGLRLVVYSGFVGLYRSITHLDLVDVLLSIIAIYFGRKIVIAFNTLVGLLR